jgi:hypothetical protein
LGYLHFLVNTISIEIDLDGEVKRVTFLLNQMQRKGRHKRSKSKQQPRRLLALSGPHGSQAATTYARVFFAYDLAAGGSKMSIVRMIRDTTLSLALLGMTAFAINPAWAGGDEAKSKMINMFLNSAAFEDSGKPLAIQDTHGAIQQLQALDVQTLEELASVDDFWDAVSFETGVPFPDAKWRTVEAYLFLVAFDVAKTHQSEYKIFQSAFDALDSDEERACLLKSNQGCDGAAMIAANSATWRLHDTWDFQHFIGDRGTWDGMGVPQEYRSAANKAVAELLDRGGERSRVSPQVVSKYVPGLDRFLTHDSQSWIANTYDRGSVKITRTLELSKSAREILASYTYSKGHGAWLRVGVERDKLVCAQFWDIPGGCLSAKQLHEARANREDQADTAAAVIMMLGGGGAGNPSGSQTPDPGPVTFSWCNVLAHGEALHFTGPFDPCNQ